MSAIAAVIATPEDRAAIMAHIIRIAAPIEGPVDHCWLFEEVRKAMGRREEDVSLEILRATGLLVRQGLFTCNSLDADGTSITFGADTRLAPGPRLMGFIWHEDDA